MRRRPALLVIGAALLIGALAVGGLMVWMGDDDDAESRRAAALPSDPPPDPGGSDPPASPPPGPPPATQPPVAAPTGPRLKLQVARIGISPDPKGAVSYYVREQEVWGGVRTAESAGLCVSVPPPGKTCYWDWDPAVEPPCPGCYEVAVRLFAYPTRSQWIPNGALVDWTGCQPQSTRPDFCYVSSWKGEKTVTVVFKQ